MTAGKVRYISTLIYKLLCSPCSKPKVDVLLDGRTAVQETVEENLLRGRYED